MLEYCQRPQKGPQLRILAIDTGTGTQDILLLDTAEPIENSLKMVVPSPTMRVAGRIREATDSRRGVLFVGVTMGGGPCTWALQRHLQASLPAFATPDAAKTFDDNLEVVTQWGVRVVGEDEASRMDGVERIELRDINLDALRSALASLGADPRFDGLALACLDHGAAPPGYSDRLFRFQHLRRVVEEKNDLLAFAYRPEEVPPYLTRARALLESAGPIWRRYSWTRRRRRRSALCRTRRSARRSDRSSSTWATRTPSPSTCATRTSTASSSTIPDCLSGRTWSRSRRGLWWAG